MIKKDICRPKHTDYQYAPEGLCGIYANLCWWLSVVMGNLMLPFTSTELLRVHISFGISYHFALHTKEINHRDFSGCRHSSIYVFIRGHFAYVYGSDYVLFIHADSSQLWFWMKHNMLMVNRLLMGIVIPFQNT